MGRCPDIQLIATKDKALVAIGIYCQIFEGFGSRAWLDVLVCKELVLNVHTERSFALPEKEIAGDPLGVEEIPNDLEESGLSYYIQSMTRRQPGHTSRPAS